MEAPDADSGSNATQKGLNVNAQRPSRRDGRYDRIMPNEVPRKINASRRCSFHLAIRSMSLVG